METLADTLILFLSPIQVSMELGCFLAGLMFSLADSSKSSKPVSLKPNLLTAPSATSKQHNDVERVSVL